VSPHSASRFLRSSALIMLFLIVSIAAFPRTRPHYGGSIRIAVDGDPMQKPSGLAWTLTLDGLTRLDSQGIARPALSDRWSSDTNNSRWQLHLRANVLFHDGRPLTPLAVVSSLTESCRTAPCPWSNATGLHIVGASIILTTDTPTPDLPSLLAQDRFRIQAINASGDSSSDTLPIGTGPFHFTRIANGLVSLAANEECWQGRPFLDAIEITTRPASRDPWSVISSSTFDLVALRPSELRQAAQQHIALLTRPAAALLLLQVREDSLNPQLRAAAALAIDRSALYQVIFQKQAEITASLLPASISGYSFLFPAERDLAHAQALRGGATPPPLTIAAENTDAMQLAAARIALNLHDAGFNVRVLPPLKESRLPNADLTLRALPLPSGSTDIALDAMLRQLGQPAAIAANDPSAAWQTEHEFLDRHTIIPLLFLPRAWTASPRLRDLQLTFDGTPDIANASLGDAP
jgi:peptide/nickel transport system substrate-binding protein